MEKWVRLFVLYIVCLIGGILFGTTEALKDNVHASKDDVDEMERVIRDDLYDTAKLNEEGRTKRKAMSLSNYLWSTSITYRVLSNYDSVYTKAIEDGIQLWEEETCIDFNKVSQQSDSNFVIKDGTGCASYTGKLMENQPIHLGNGCGKKGTVAHVIGHLLGFLHEHSRPDRDLYVQVHYENVKTHWKHNFQSYGWDAFVTLGIPYDYSSIMHYPLKELSKNGYNTITLKEANMDQVVGQRIGLSFYDVKLANYLYCNSSCPQGLSWSACQNDGYRDPKNCSRCKCPDGLTGPYCTDIKPGVNANCGATSLMASSTWQTVKSPNYDKSTSTANSECTWRITTTGSNKRIRLKFTGTFKFPCSPDSSCLDYIEVRHKDMVKAGPRFCCSTPTTDLVSHGNEILLLLRATSGLRDKSFSLQYKEESCGGCSVAAGIKSAPACVETQTYTCNATFNDCYNNGTNVCVIKIRHNTCYREVKTCCSGFRLSGNTCVI